MLVNGGDEVADAVYQAALAAGIAKGFVPDDLSQVIAYTGLVDPGAQATVRFTTPSAPGSYTYICTFAGHYLAGMKGVLIVQNDI
jgi:azurin